MTDTPADPRRPAPPSIEESATLLGVHQSTLYRAVQQGWDGYPETYARFSRARSRSAKKPGPKPRGAAAGMSDLGDDPDSYRMRMEERRWAVEFRRAKAQRELLQLRVLEGQLVPRPDVLRLYLHRVAAVRGALLPLPRNVLARVDLPPEQAAALEAEFAAEIRSVLEEFARPHPLLEETSVSDHAAEPEADDREDPGALDDAG